MNAQDSAISTAPTSRQTTWAILSPLVRPWRGTLALVALCVLAARALDLAPALIVQRVVDEHLATQRAAGLLELGLL